MGRKIWNGSKKLCRFMDRLFIWYVRFCLLVWVCVWGLRSLDARRFISFDEVQSVFDVWADGGGDSAAVGR